MLKSWKNDDEKSYEQYKKLLLAKYEKNNNLINLELFSVYARHNLITYAQNYLIWNFTKSYLNLILEKRSNESLTIMQ